MTDIFSILLPVFFLIGLGFVSARFGLFTEAGVNAILAFSIYFATPCLLMRVVLYAQLEESFDRALIISFYLPVVFCFLGMILIARFFWKRRSGDSVSVGFASTFGNTVMLGVPVIISAFGEAALTPLVGIVGLHAVCMYLMGITLMEAVRQDGLGWLVGVRRTIAAISRNSILIGIATGALGNLVGFTPLPAPIETITKLVGNAAVPLGLFGVGAALVRYRLRSELLPATLVSSSKLILQPAFTYVLTRWYFELDPLYVGVGTIAAAMPLGINAYLFASMYDRGTEIAAGGIVLSTLLSIVSLSLWLLILRLPP